jgi:hypothetical protein
MEHPKIRSSVSEVLQSATAITVTGKIGALKSSFNFSTYRSETHHTYLEAALTSKAESLSRSLLRRAI